MRNLSTKVNRDLLTPGEFNSLNNELENIVTTTGGTLDGSEGPDNDLNMLGQASATYGSAGDFYGATLSGSVVVLDRDSVLESPQSYMSGLKIIFRSTFTNTGSVSVDLVSLGQKDFTHPDGTTVSSGTITPDVYYTAIFNNTDDRFELTHNTKLTDNSIADTLHRHSELVSPDGTTDPVFSIDNDGKASLTNGTSINEFSTDGTLAGDSDDAVPTEKAVKAAVAAGADLVNDTSPQLGGDLDCNSHGINMGDQIIDQPKIRDYGESVNILGSLGGGSDTINLELGNVVTATVDTAAQTFAFTNPPVSGTAGSFTLILTNGGSQTVTWPASVKWEDGAAPSLTTAGVDILTFNTFDGGTIWYGFAAGLDMS